MRNSSTAPRRSGLSVTGEYALAAATTLDDVIRLVPRAAATFNRLGIDACCGGARTLSAAAADASLTLPTLLAAIADDAA